MKKLKLLNYLPLLSLIIVFTSCSTIEVSTFKNPDMVNTTLSGLCIYAAFGDFIDRENMENELASYLFKNQVKADASINIATPVDNPDEYMIIEKLKSSGINTVLHLSLNEFYRIKNYLQPPAYETNNRDHSDIMEDIDLLTLILRGLESKPKNYTEIIARLIDLRDDKIVWVGYFRFKSTPEEDYYLPNPLIKKLAKKIADNLIEDYLSMRMK